MANICLHMNDANTCPRCKGIDKLVASSGNSDVVSVRYRLLERDEVIQQGDQFLLDDAENWNDVENWTIGCKWCPFAFQPMRRAH